jgi:hypothetical protein
LFNSAVVDGEATVTIGTGASGYVGGATTTTADSTSEPETSSGELGSWWATRRSTLTTPCIYSFLPLGQSNGVEYAYA